MLRKRSRPFQQDTGADAVVHKARGSLLFTVPGLFVGLNSRSMDDSAKSPTSPLDLKRSPKPSWDCEKVGLGLVDSLNDDGLSSSDTSRNILFGSQMMRRKTHLDSIKEKTQLEVGSLPIVIGDGDGFMSGIELSEDYTCIISHGPNPKTTHIFGDYIVEERRNVDKNVGSDEFLSSCFACKKKLKEGDDVYIYRGDKAFCSCNCRDREILFEEETDSIHEEIFVDGDGISFLD